MLNFTRTIKGLLILTVMAMLIAACSSPKYYVFKTIKHTPVEKNEIEQETAATTELAQEKFKTIPEEELALASTEVIAAPVQLKEIQRQMAEKATSKETQKISKLEQIKTAIQVKKEIKKIRKSLEQEQDLTQATETQDEPKSQLVALLLAIFVGVLGIHRFYLGYTTIGILQLLTAGGCGVWALIDLIRIATGDLKPADGSEYEETI